MRPLIYFFIVSIFVLSSCDSRNRKISKNDKISIAGKWHRFSMANGYTEFDIDSQNVVFYNHKVGRFKFAYEIEKDSFKYLTHGYAAKISYFGDSLFLKGNDNTTATLYRFNEPDIPFDSIPEEKDSLLFGSYLYGFDKRLIRELEKAGVKFFDNKNEPDDSTFRQLLNMKEH
jgi:hypothetical protein